MENFVYHNPTKVLFGRGTIGAVGRETRSFGQRVLLVSGQGSARRSGVLQQVRESLAAAGVNVVDFAGVTANPTLGQARQGIRIAREECIEAVCAVGGGSAIDTAKAITAGAVVDHDVWKFFTGKKSVRAPLPLTAVSTMAASGSEMNPGMVLTNEQTQQKFGFANRHLYPRVAIMDPETTFTVPADTTAHGAIDALAHLLEFYLTCRQPGTTIQDRYMEGLALSIMESCDAALADPRDYQARSTLMWAAALALGGLAAAGLGKVGFPMHLVEHSLSALYGVAHGAGLAVVIPGWLRWTCDPGALQRMCQFSKRVLGVSDDGPEAPGQGADRLTSWFQRIGAPLTLQDLGIGAEAIDDLAENALALARIWRMPQYGRREIEEILRCCLVPV